MRNIFIVCTLLLFAYGCASVPLNVANIETDTVEYEVLGEGVGSSLGIMFLNLIPIGQNDRFVNAYKNAIESRGGDALLNPVVSERWFWAYLFNGYKTTVRGIVIKYKK